MNIFYRIGQFGGDGGAKWVVRNINGKKSVEVLPDPSRTKEACDRIARALEVAMGLTNDRESVQHRQPVENKMLEPVYEEAPALQIKQQQKS